MVDGLGEKPTKKLCKGGGHGSLCRDVSCCEKAALASLHQKAPYSQGGRLAKHEVWSLRQSSHPILVGVRESGWGPIKSGLVESLLHQLIACSPLYSVLRRALMHCPDVPLLISDVCHACGCAKQP